METRHLGGLTEEEQDQLALLLVEARSRGIDISSEISIAQKKPWPFDSRGYLVKGDGSLYTPIGGQEGFIDSRARFLGFIGSRGSGKSACGAQKSARKISKGLPGVIGNPDFENFKISTWPEFREWLPWDRVVERHRYRQNPEWQPLQPFTMGFVAEDGRTVSVICKGIKDPNSARGPNINWFWYDEAQRDDSGEAWQVANASVRIGIDPQAWVTATPAGIDHWMYDLFVEENIPDDAIRAFEESGMDRPVVEYFKGSLEENKANVSPDFYASLLSVYHSGWLREQEVFGRFIAQGGLLGDPSWFDGKIITQGQLETKEIYARARYWDLAASEKKLTKKKRNDPDESSGTKMSWNMEDDEFYVEDQVNGHWEWKDLKEVIVDTAKEDGPYVSIFLEQEPASGGKNQVAELTQYITSILPGHSVKGHLPREAGDKVMRAYTWFGEAKEGKIYLVAGEWNQGFLKQLASFPEGRHDDRIDSVSGARHTVAPVRTWKTIKYMSL
jgi:predicted phage terminase large subunit-like protein